MTGKKTREAITTPEASHPDPTDRTDFMLTNLNCESSEDCRERKEQGTRRHEMPELRGFSLRQSRLTVPKPSYVRYASSASWKPTTENSDAGTERADGNIVAEENNRLAPSTNTKDGTVSRFSAKTVKWTFVALAILTYIIFRMLERYA